VRTNHQTVAAGHSVELDLARWQELFDQLLCRVAGRFARVDLPPAGQGVRARAAGGPAMKELLDDR